MLQGAPDTLAVGLYEDDLNPTRPGNVRVTAIHALDGAPAVDVLQVDGDMVMPLVQNLAFGQPYGAVDIPAASADLVLVPAGGNVSNPVLRISGVSLPAGTEVVVVALDGPSALVLTEPTAASDASNSGLVRLVHASQGSPAVDVYVGDNLIAPGLAYGVATPHVALAAGTLNVVVRVAKASVDSTPLVSATLDLAAGSAVTVVISGPIDGLVVNAVPNNIAALDPTVARVQFTDATGGGASLDASRPASRSMRWTLLPLKRPPGRMISRLGLGGAEAALTQTDDRERRCAVRRDRGRARRRAAAHRRGDRPQRAAGQRAHSRRADRRRRADCCLRRRRKRPPRRPRRRRTSTPLADRRRPDARRRWCCPARRQRR